MGYPGILFSRECNTIIDFNILWNESASCYTNKQELSRPSATSGPHMWMTVPQTVSQRVLPPPRWLLRSEGCKKPGGQGYRTGPRQLRCVREERMQGAQSRASSRPSEAKFLNLIPDLWCSAARSLSCKLAYILPPLLPPWGSFLRATEVLSPGLGVLNTPTQKNDSLLSGCDYTFLVDYICVPCMCIYLHIIYICVLHILCICMHTHS